MASPDQPAAEVTPAKQSKPPRQRISQSEVPRHPLRNALRIPEALADNFAQGSARPIDLAAALTMSPNSSGFRTLCGAALGYGLTTGGPNSQGIGLTDLGRRIVSPLREGDDVAAKREAVLKPGVERRFLEDYDGHPLPLDNIAHNVLESMGVPRTATVRVYDIIRKNAEDVGFIKLIKEKAYVDLGPAQSTDDAGPESPTRTPGDSASPAPARAQEEGAVVPGTPSGDPPTPSVRTKRVFVSGGARSELAAQITKLLKFGGREAVEKTEPDTSDGPRLLAVVDEMRECSSGVFFLSAQPALEKPLAGHHGVTESSLLELGAAVALFGPRCVLVAEAGAEVPPWLSDLPRVTCTSADLTLTDITAIVSALMSVDGADE